LLKLLGKNTLGLGYAVAFSDLILAPFMPSNTARSGGTLFPILRNIPALYGSEPGPTARKIGSYIMWTALAVTCVTSSMFLTALAPNLAGVTQVKNIAKLTVDWTQWATGFLPAGVILILAVPILAYFLYPPEVKKSTDVPKWAGAERDGPDCAGVVDSEPGQWHDCGADCDCAHARAENYQLG
jgi:L-tartrate/succinate antiporter